MVERRKKMYSSARWTFMDRVWEAETMEAVAHIQVPPVCTNGRPARPVHFRSRRTTDRPSCGNANAFLARTFCLQLITQYIQHNASGKKKLLQNCALCLLALDTRYVNTRVNYNMIVQCLAFFLFQAIVCIHCTFYHVIITTLTIDIPTIRIIFLRHMKLVHYLIIMNICFMNMLSVYDLR